MSPDCGQATSTSERVRRHRDRRQRGVRIYPVELSDTHIDYLIEKGLLTSQDRDDRDRVARALSTFIDQLRIPDRKSEWSFTCELLGKGIDDLIRQGWVKPEERYESKIVLKAFGTFIEHALDRR